MLIAAEVRTKCDECDVEIIAPECAIRTFIVLGISRFHSWKIRVLEDAADVLNTGEHTSFSRYRMRSPNPQLVRSSHIQ
jgi:hypothetical protein